MNFLKWFRLKIYCKHDPYLSNKAVLAVKTYEDVLDMSFIHRISLESIQAECKRCGAKVKPKSWIKE